MKSSDKTTRRSFTRSVLHGILALPFASALATAETKRTPKRKQRGRVDVKTHDTPPPVTLLDGSLEIETVDQLMTASNMAPFVFTGFTATPEIAHIRVLDKKGIQLHYEPNAKGSTIKFVLEKEDGTVIDEVLVEKAGANLQISSNLKLDAHPNSNPNGFRRHKCTHPGHAPNQRFRVKSIEILGAPQAFKVTAKPFSGHPTFFSDEFKVLLWLDP
jgi:hypothetical protein